MSDLLEYAEGADIGGDPLVVDLVAEVRRLRTELAESRDSSHQLNQTANRAVLKLTDQRRENARLREAVEKVKAAPRFYLKERRNGYTVEDYSRPLFEANRILAILDAALSPTPPNDGREQ